MHWSSQVQAVLKPCIDPLHVGLDLEMERLHLAGTESPQLMRGPLGGHHDIVTEIHIFNAGGHGTRWLMGS